MGIIRKPYDITDRDRLFAQLNGPKEQSVSTIEEFKHLFLAPGFLSFAGVVIAASVIIVLFVAPKYVPVRFKPSIQ